jgi:hypothetical protein
MGKIGFRIKIKSTVPVGEDAGPQIHSPTDQREGGKYADANVVTSEFFAY